VYDITDAESFNKVQKWVKELRKIVGTDITIVIAGNKADLERNRQVNEQVRPKNKEASAGTSAGTSSFARTACERTGLKRCSNRTTTSCSLTAPRPLYSNSLRTDRLKTIYSKRPTRTTTLALCPHRPPFVRTFVCPVLQVARSFAALLHTATFFVHTVIYPPQEVLAYAESVGATHHYTSAKQNMGLSECFNDLAKKMVERKKSKFGGGVSGLGGPGGGKKQKLVVLDDVEDGGGKKGGCC